MSDTTCPKCQTTFASRPGDGGEEVCPRCLMKFVLGSAGSTATVLSSDPRVGTLFRGMEVLAVLGRGGMGVVYRARQKDLGREVALKLVSDALAGDAEFVERFRREAKVLSSLSHPNIVAVHEFGFEGGVPFLVMELVEGSNLRKLLGPKKLAAESALRIIPQVCEALEYAHRAGVVHRDIKPENILVTPDGRVKIADFGLARLSESGVSLTRTDATMGTPQYMAPEQVENSKGVDHRADIYSMGVVFYEMLTGELPLGRFEPPSCRASVNAAFDPIVLKALERRPEQRYQQASEVRADVARVPAGGAGRVKPSPARLAIVWCALMVLILIMALAKSADYLFWGPWLWVLLALSLGGAWFENRSRARNPGGLSPKATWAGIGVLLAVGILSISIAVTMTTPDRMIAILLGSGSALLGLSHVVSRLGSDSRRMMASLAISSPFAVTVLLAAGWVIADEIRYADKPRAFKGLDAGLDRTEVLRRIGEPHGIWHTGPVAEVPVGGDPLVRTLAQNEVWSYGRQRLFKWQASPAFFVLANDRSGTGPAPWEFQVEFGLNGRVLKLHTPEISHSR
ncbi:MAG: serine/threonine-protein kinase [Planctomycetota bacterium]